MKIHALITGAKLGQTVQSAWQYAPSAAQTHGCINLLDFLLQDQKLHRHCFPPLIIFYMAKNGIPKKLSPGLTIETTDIKQIKMKFFKFGSIFFHIF
jgi:hypothetical protein